MRGVKAVAMAATSRNCVDVCSVIVVPWIVVVLVIVLVVLTTQSWQTVRVDRQLVKAIVVRTCAAGLMMVLKMVVNTMDVEVVVLVFIVVLGVKMVIRDVEVTVCVVVIGVVRMMVEVINCVEYVVYMNVLVVVFVTVVASIHAASAFHNVMENIQSKIKHMII